MYMANQQLMTGRVIFTKCELSARNATTELYVKPSAVCTIFSFVRLTGTFSIALLSLK